MNKLQYRIELNRVKLFYKMMIKLDSMIIVNGYSKMPMVNLFHKRPIF